MRRFVLSVIACSGSHLLDGARSRSGANRGTSGECG